MACNCTGLCDLSQRAENSKWKKLTFGMSAVLPFTFKKTSVNSLGNDSPFNTMKGWPLFITVPVTVLSQLDPLQLTRSSFGQLRTQLGVTWDGKLYRRFPGCCAVTTIVIVVTLLSYFSHFSQTVQGQVNHKICIIYGLPWCSPTNSRKNYW